MASRSHARIISRLMNIFIRDSFLVSACYAPCAAGKPHRSPAGAGSTALRVAENLRPIFQGWNVA